MLAAPSGADARHPSARSRSAAAAVAMAVLLLCASASVTVLGAPPQGGARSSPGEDRRAPSVDEWPTFKADDQRTGEAASGAPSVGKVLWTAKYRPATIFSSPVVWNATVYIGVASTMHALWAKNGTERWSYEVINPIHTAPTVADGAVYFGMNDISGVGVVALDARTGDHLWNASIPDYVTCAPLVAGQFVYAGCQDGLLYCLWRSNGTTAWTFNATLKINYGALAYWNGMVLFGVDALDDNTGMVLAVNATTGKEAWNAPVVGSVWSAPAVVEGTVLVGTAADKFLGPEIGNGYVYRLDATTGAQLWRSENLGRVYASPSVAGGRVFIGTFGKTISEIELIEPRMYCLDLATDGHVLWSYTIMHNTQKAKVWSSVAVAGTKILFGDELGYMSAWSVLGLPIWSTDIGNGSAVKVSPAVAMEQVYAANTMGEVVCFGSQPDLTVSSGAIGVEDQYPHLGQRVHVSAVVSNIGDKTATGHVYIYNGSLDEWDAVINSTTVVLEPGRSTPVTALWTADEVGPRAVWVRVTDVVPNEADDTNNEAKRVLEVLPSVEGWLMQGSDAQATSFTPADAPTNNITKWLRSEGGGRGLGMAVTPGMVLFPTADRLVALNRTDGTVIWSSPLGSNATTVPAVGDGAVFVGTAAGMAVALDLEEGTVRFSRHLNGTPSAAPVTLGATLFLGTTTETGGGWLYALDTLDGSTVWSRSMDKPVRARVAVMGERLFAVSDIGAVLALNTTTGALVWQFPVGTAPGGSLTAAPVVSGGRLFAPSSSGYVYCLDADPSEGIDEGQPDVGGSLYDLIWTFHDDPAEPFNLSGAVVEGSLVLVEGELRVIALNLSTGAIAWRGGEASTAPFTTEVIAINGSVVVGGSSLDILDASDGERIWTYDRPVEPFAGAPAALDGMLFAADARGIVYAFGKVRNIPPVARIREPLNNREARINESITFDASTTTDDKDLPETAFQWDFGDGNLSLSRVTSHTYELSGIYHVTLTVTDSDGAKDNATVTVHVLQNHAPALDLAMVTPAIGTAQETYFNFSVRYTDPDGDPPQFIVMKLADDPRYQFITLDEVDTSDENYTDGKLYSVPKTLGSEPYPSVLFSASDGIATAEVTISGPRVLVTRTFPNNVGDIEVTLTYVGPNELEFEPVSSPPTSFPTSLFPIDVYIGLTLNTTYLQDARIAINYTYHATEGFDLTTLSIYRWTVSGEEAEWKYVPSSRVDIARGLVTADISSLLGDIYAVLGNKLSPPPNRAPIPVITFDSRTYRPGQRVDFDGSGSMDPDERALNDRIVEWVWDFGDGTPVQHGKNATHVFEHDGVYDVRLKVTDANGADNSTIVKVTVRAEEEASWLLWLALVGILVLIVLLFYPKNYYRGKREDGSWEEGDEEASEGVGPEKGAPEALESAMPPKRNGRQERQEGPKGDIDDIIDELEEDREHPVKK